MSVRGVLVLCGVFAAAGAEPSEGVAVKQEVEKIFKSVEEFLAKGDPEVKRDFGPTQTQTPGASETRQRVEDAVSVPEPPAQSRSSPEERTGAPFGQPVAFPVGVIVSDNLYPLVVGKNVDSGEPFVMNLNKQHALVVARTGGEDYRLVIPFPVMVGAPSTIGGYEEDEPTPEYRTIPPKKPRKYRLKNPYFRPYPPNIHKKYPVKPQPYNYDAGEPVPLAGSSKVPANYAQNYQSYKHYNADDPPPPVQEPRYRKHPVNGPKRYLKNPHYRNYYGEERKNYAVNEKYRPIPGPEGRSNVHNQTGPGFQKEQITYHVEGPKYNPPRRYPQHYVQGRYRHAPSELENPQLENQNYPPAGSTQSRNYPSRQYHSEQPGYSPYPSHRYGAHSGVPRDFRPSPFLGNISEDAPLGPGGLEPQSEVFESYDDRGGEFTEQDYLDSIRESPEAHSSSGVVRHVTYHADDYLGKIYEEMYYRLPETQSRSRGQVNTEHTVSGDSNQRLGPQEFPQRQEAEEEGDYRRNTTEVAEPRPSSEPVSFHEVAGKHVVPTRT